MEKENKLPEEYNELFEKYKQMGYKKFSILGTNKLLNSDKETLNDKFNKDDVHKWFSNPEKYEKELRNLSRYLYISKGIYYTTINFYSNLLTLDYVIVPRFSNFYKDNKDSILNSKQKTIDYCDDILQKPVLRNIIKATLKDSYYYGYERSNRGSYYLQRLPNDYCREGAIVNGLPSIEFDFDYFKNREEKLDLYDGEFKTKYKKYINVDGKKNDKFRWQQLDYLKTICIPLESEDFNFPALTGIFDDLIDLDDYFKYMKQSTELDTARILLQTPPMNKDNGEMLVDPDIVQFFQNAIADVLDERFKIVSTPFDVDSISFTQSKMGDIGFDGVDKMKDTIWNGVGVAKPIFGETDSASGLKLNHETNVAFVFSIVEKIEMWVNQRLKRIGTKKYGFKVKFLPTTNIYRKETFDMFNALLSIGGSLNMVISSAGINPDDYIKLLQLENLEDIKSYLSLPDSIYTQSGKDNGAGRDKKDDGDIDDSGEKTRDKDGNDR